MTDTNLPATLTPRQIGRRTRSEPGRVTGRLKRALDDMALDGIKDNEAAVKNGITVTRIRKALERPHVRSYYRAQCEVARSRESGANIRRLVEIRDAADNMPAVQAIKMLESLADQPASGRGGAQAVPGLVVQIISSSPAAVRAVDVEQGKTVDLSTPSIPYIGERPAREDP